MTIKQRGGIFGRNPTFNDVTIEGELTFDGDIDVNSDLKVSGDLEVLGDITVNSSPFPEIILKDADLSNVYGRIYSASGNTVIESDVANQQAGSSLNFTVDGDTKAQISSGGNLTVNNGNLVIGTSGKGIDFSATPGTGTSELFDDYEEGTWTPVLSDGTNNATMGGAAGSYTKIGRQVFCKCRVVTTALGSVSGDIRVTGLPFTVAAGSGLENLAGGVASQGSGLAITAGSSISISPQQNTTRALLYVWDDAAGTTAMQATEWTDDGNAYFEFSYLA